MSTHGHIEVDDAFSSATDFVAESLHALSPAGFPLDPRRFEKAFRNALLLKPVDNPTDFVRNYVLDVQPIQVDRLRRSIEHWRILTARIENLKAQSVSLANILRIVGRVIENERAIAVTNWQISRLSWEIFFREARHLEEDLREKEEAADRANVEATGTAARLATINAELAAVALSVKATDGEQLALMYESDRNLVLSQRGNAMTPVRQMPTRTTAAPICPLQHETSVWRPADRRRRYPPLLGRFAMPFAAALSFRLRQPCDCSGKMGNQIIGREAARAEKL